MFCVFVIYAVPSRARRTTREFSRVHSTIFVIGCAPPNTRRAMRPASYVDERLSRIAGGVSLFVNAQRSWACVRRRQHCFRNLDVDYLTIKAFLLERFLHDALYEAPTAEVFNEFLDIRPAPAAQVSFASSPSLPRSAVSGSLSR